MEHEYYMLKRKATHKSITGKMTGSFGYPSFKNDEQEELFYRDLSDNNLTGNVDSPIEFYFNPNVSDGATLGDYHEEIHYNIMIFHLRIIELIQSMDIKNIEYIPTRIYKHKPKGAFSNDYTILNPIKKIDCMDKEKSRWKAGFEGEVVGIDALVVDSKVLETIPLNERLIFRLDEKPKRILFHKSVAQPIIEMDTKGCYFYDLATWKSRTFYLHGFGPKFANR